MESKMRLSRCPGCGSKARLHSDTVEGVDTFFVACSALVPEGTCWQGPNARNYEEAVVLWEEVAVCLRERDIYRAKAALEGE